GGLAPAICARQVIAELEQAHERPREQIPEHLHSGSPMPSTREDDRSGVATGWYGKRRDSVATSPRWVGRSSISGPISARKRACVLSSIPIFLESVFSSPPTAQAMSTVIASPSCAVRTSTSAQLDRPTVAAIVWCTMDWIDAGTTPASSVAGSATTLT